MTKTQIQEACRELMETVPAAYLTAIDADGQPRTRAMLNLRNREQFASQAHVYANHQQDFMVYIATNTSSRKRREIEANPRVCVYYCRPEAFHGVSLIGEIEIVDDLVIKEVLWADGWEQYFPTGKPDDPDYTLLRLFPKVANGWYQDRKFESSLGSG